MLSGTWLSCFVYVYYLILGHSPNIAFVLYNTMKGPLLYLTHMELHYSLIASFDSNQVFALRRVCDIRRKHQAQQ